MKLDVKFVGVESNEQTPNVALYQVSASGQVKRKLATVQNGELEISAELSRNKSAVVALGPDTETISKLDPKSLLQLRVSDQLKAWEKNEEISIPSLWWRQWIFWTVCVSGQVSKCTPWFFDVRAIRANALGRVPPIIFPERCSPICNGVVKISKRWCCWPILLIDVPIIIEKLKRLLEEEPIQFPSIPNPPDPSPVDRATLANVQLALAKGKTASQFAPNTDLARHLQNLEAMSGEEAIEYIQLNPPLWRFWCTCSSYKVGETTVNPDGTFNFCWEPFLLFNCRRSYFYKVRQW